METKQIKAFGTKASDKPLEELTIKRRVVQPHDVEFKILYCGICHSDLHQIKDDFGGTTYPIVPGHEMAGQVTAVGDHVTKFKVGDIVAVGCIVDSCGHCEYCEEGIEQFCDEETINWPLLPTYKKSIKRLLKALDSNSSQIHFSA